MRQQGGSTVSLKSIGLCAVCVCIGAVAVTTFLQGGQPVTQPHAQSPAASASANGITFVTVDGASPGSYAHVTVRTTPGVECSIRYVTPHGTISSAKGLDCQTSDSNGKSAWTWKIGSHTQPGTGNVTVTCNGTSATTSIDIGR